MAAEQLPGYTPPGRFWRKGAHEKPKEREPRQCRSCPADITHRNGNCKQCSDCALKSHHKPAPAKAKRTCSDCPEDITARAKHSTRCWRCQLERNREMKLAQYERERTRTIQERLRRTGARVCELCAGMPHAREPGRVADMGHLGSVMVANEDGICNGCGEAYAPEPPPERGEVLRSSMGTVEKHGELYGHTSAGNVDARRYTSKDAFPRIKTFQRNNR